MEDQAPSSARDARSDGRGPADHLFMGEVTQPVLIKDNGLLLVSRPDGSIDGGQDGAGLHYHDTRYLSRYALRIGGQPPMPLMTSSARGSEAVIQLSNYDIDEGEARRLELQSLRIEVRRRLDGQGLRLVDDITVESFVPGLARCRIELLLDARFEPLFELRGAKPKRRGVLERRQTESEVAFAYAGADGVRRGLVAAFAPAPAKIEAHDGEPVRVVFDLALRRRATAALSIVFQLSESGAAAAPAPSPPAPWLENSAFRSDNARLDAAMAASFRDLRLLQTGLDARFIAGGAPWFVAPFARDSLIAALQILPFDPRPAEGVARQLAVHQGLRHDPETGEQPGKIPHEFRVGEMAHLAEVPHHPSYLSVDATPLFLVLVGRHAAWTGRLDLFEHLREPVERALAWLREHGDSDGDGYVDYTGETPDGLLNQGWKDSPDGVIGPDGSIPKPPIALCEVQGYVYLAKSLLAEIFRRIGDRVRARALAAEAHDLAQRFNRDFWMEDEGCFCLALARGGVQVRAVTSNAGHALWSGVAEPDKARRTAERLLRPDMWSGWGVRTLSERAPAHNPLHYHRGSVWPFDNALLVEGLMRYGQRDAAVRLVGDVLGAADAFALSRLPEFYVGFQRADGLLPARCPFAEPLQAWSSGALPAMVAALLGLRGLDGGEVRAEAPLLPPGTSRVELILHGAAGDPVRWAFPPPDTPKS
jgi:glycogen debranching enzyme